jgi:hypothetical protein
MHEKNVRRLYVASAIGESGEREISGVTPTSPRAASLDSLTLHCV